MQLENQVSRLQGRIHELSAELDSIQQRTPDRSRVFAAGLAGDVVTLTRGQRPPASRPVAGQLSLASLVQRRSRLRALPAGKQDASEYAGDGYIQSI